MLRERGSMVRTAPVLFSPACPRSLTSSSFIIFTLGGLEVGLERGVAGILRMGQCGIFKDEFDSS